MTGVLPERFRAVVNGVPADLDLTRRVVPVIVGDELPVGRVTGARWSGPGLVELDIELRGTAAGREVAADAAEHLAYLRPDIASVRTGRPGAGHRLLALRVSVIESHPGGPLLCAPAAPAMPSPTASAILPPKPTVDLSPLPPMRSLRRL